MDRQLTAEFPGFYLASDGSGSWEQSPATDTRVFGINGYVQEMKLDLSGYVQSDLTVGFRRSFEQDGGPDSINWLKAYDPNTDLVIETTIVSSVPLNDAQLTSALVTSPGFIPPFLTGLEPGNFNREHIIHGRYLVMYANSTIGGGGFGSSGNATLMKVTDNIFSSLEPTAADCLYCYRVFAVPAAATSGTGIERVGLPPKRIILDAFTVAEPDLEYMMRLKRSYELANQV